MLDKVELSVFEPLVGESFELVLGEGEAVTLELSEAASVGELSARQAAELGKRLPFSLVFRGPGGLRLEQAIRTLRNPRLGELQLFLVQLDCTAEASVFEAVFT